MRQGTHQGAQKSTTTGIWLRLMCLSNDTLSSSSGCASNRASLRWLHMGALVN